MQWPFLAFRGLFSILSRTIVEKSSENTGHINPVLGKTQGDFPYFVAFYKMQGVIQIYYGPWEFSAQGLLSYFQYDKCGPCFLGISSKMTHILFLLFLEVSKVKSSENTDQNKRSLKYFLKILSYFSRCNAGFKKLPTLTGGGRKYGKLLPNCVAYDTFCQNLSIFDKSIDIKSWSFMPL